MTKIAILSDIHGNMTAFSAVLKDAQAHHADEYWFLGDLFLPGPGAAKLWDRLHALPLTHLVKGNWDDDLFWVLDSPVDLNQPTDVYFSRLVAYLWPQLNADILTAIRHWPLHEVFEQDGLTISLAHNLPTSNHGHRLYPDQPQSNFDQIAPDPKIDIADLRAYPSAITALHQQWSGDAESWLNWSSIFTATTFTNHDLCRLCFAEPSSWGNDGSGFTSGSI